jgi:nitroreductase
MTRPAVRPGALTKEQIETAVYAATQAPSLLNCQPWRFTVDGDAIDVHAVPERSPGVVDPTGREVFISLGAAMLNLRLAVAALGREPVVQLLPEPSQRTHVARLRIGRPKQISALEQPLHAAIGARRSSRQPFTAQPVQPEQFLHLQDSAAVEGGWLDAATGSHRAAVLDVLHEADLEQRSNAAVVRDIGRWTHDRRDLRVGIGTDSLGPRPRDPSAAVRDLGLGTPVPARGWADFETHALLGVLLTSGDAPVDWLRAGLAMERVLLTAASSGIAVGVLSHGTEVVDLRPLVRDPSSRWRFPQLVLRFGYATASMPRTPRLPLSEVLEYADAPPERVPPPKRS